MEINLPWPPKELSPNARNHWSVVAKAKRIYRTECWAAAKQVLHFRSFAGINKIPLKISFYPPSKRHYDLDNCVASIKSGLDGIADAMQVNDRVFEIDPKMEGQVLGLVKINIGL